MTKTRENRLIAMLLAVTLLSGRIHAADQASPVDALIGGENAFALDLYGQLKSGDGNLFFSPYSISTCLGMTYAGARGKTAQQMAQALEFTAGPTEVAVAMGRLEKQLNPARQENGIELNTANGLWVQSGYPLLPAYLETAKQQFGARIFQAKLQEEPETMRQEINGWVSERTKNKINDLLPVGVPNPDTDLVLVNAIYFKGRWVHSFEKAMTANAPFTLESGQQVQAKMMNVETHFRYAALDDLQLLELPYSSGSTSRRPDDAPLSMVILLPKETNGLKNLEHAMNGSALRDWQANAHLSKVKVLLPKFKMTAEYKLNRALQAMGMGDAFSMEADFSGISGKRSLFISEVVHKAYVNVYEEGTEAAAATGVVTEHALDGDAPVFRADHPFIFLIRDNQTGCILFLGRVMNPTM